jgi:hypothetical protein
MVQTQPEGPNMLNIQRALDHYGGMAAELRLQEQVRLSRIAELDATIAREQRFDAELRRT